MSAIRCILGRTTIMSIPRCYYSSSSNTEEEMQFRVLNLRSSRTAMQERRKIKKPAVLQPRSKEMPMDQDWGSVWPGPRTFHPASVPLPLRQGWVDKGAPPSKFGNAELMKIPNFLHLTPPVIKRQCEALKQFCTPWPKELKTDADCARHFPLEITSSNYCHSSPTIRDPMARIITAKFKLADLQLDLHAKDKFLRLVGDRYDEATGYVTIVTDRCPTRKQNYEYALYLITALYHESCNVEPWEKLKSDADMEIYEWEKSASKKAIETLFGKEVAEIPEAENYSKCVENFMNEGESEYTLEKYGTSARMLLGLPTLT